MLEQMCSHYLHCSLKWYVSVAWLYEDQFTQILVFDFLVSFFLQGKKADQLIKYFGEDPVRCPFEQGKEISFIDYP